MADNTNIHYSAFIKIEKVKRGPDVSRDLNEKRRTEEVTTITVKAKTMPALVTKLTKHIALIEDDTAAADFD